MGFKMLSESIYGLKRTNDGTSLCLLPNFDIKQKMHAVIEA